MEPGVIRMFSSSPPPMDDAPEEDDEDEFGDFGTFSAVGVVPTSVSFSELETPTTFNQTRALNATSPPDFAHARGPVGVTGAGRANGHPGRGEKSVRDAPNGEPQAGTLTNGFQGRAPRSRDAAHDFADFTAFSDKANADSGDILDHAQSREMDGHNAVNLSNSNRTELKFANFAVFCEDSEVTLDAKQSQTVCSQRDAVTELEGSHDATQKDHAFPNRTEQTFMAFSAFPHHCTLENDFTGSETVCGDDDAAFYLKKDETQTNEDCECVNGNVVDTCGSVCGSDVASDCGVEAGEKATVVVNGTAEKDRDGGGSETETETSLGRPLSTEALEEFADTSTTGSVPSPATPTGDDQELGEFGLSTHDDDNTEQHQPHKAQDQEEEEENDEDFGDFNSPEFKTEENTELSTSDCVGNFNFAATEKEELKFQIHPQNEAEQPAEDGFDDFADFNSPKTNDKSKAEFPESEPPNAHQQEEPSPGAEDDDSFEDFADFNAPTLEKDVDSEAGLLAIDSFGRLGSAEEETGWSAFGDEDATSDGDGGATWAAFSSEGSEPSPAPNTASLCQRLQQIFSSSFPQSDAPSVDDGAPTLRLLLGPDAGAQEHSSLCVRVWAQLEDIHEALGLRFQWGGSCCNKALLCSLGIDTRNILFTGQKKQPVIVPMYAAGLGMLEPVKPVSAAEMIASIAQNSACTPESVQEALPPVQFDWSSSGLTNPLDGVDPELFELTTAKMDSNKMSDAFARLMSTVQATSTQRKPRREENLSDEALKVISRFPDLSFMTAKVLMFPATLTPNGTGGGGAGTESAAD